MVLAHRDDEQAGHALLDERIDHGALALAVLVDAGRDDHEAPVPDHVLDRPGDG